MHFSMVTASRFFLSSSSDFSLEMDNDLEADRTEFFPMLILFRLFLAQQQKGSGMAREWSKHVSEIIWTLKTKQRNGRFLSFPTVLCVRLRCWILLFVCSLVFWFCYCCCFGFFSPFHFCVSVMFVQLMLGQSVRLYRCNSWRYWKTQSHGKFPGPSSPCGTMFLNQKYFTDESTGTGLHNFALWFPMVFWNGLYLLQRYV